MAFLLTNSQSHVIPHTHPTSDINGLTELIQANAVVVSATAPENPTSGKLWYNTIKGVFNIYNGSSWILVGPEVTPITKAQYDALSNEDKNDGRFYLITDNDGTIIVDWANVENKPTIPTSLGELSGTSDDITEGSSHLFMTPAERTNLGNQSGVNTGDQSASDFDIKDLADTTNLRSTWSGKQDAISDLATIRSGASAGATAVQPNDNVSTLTNDAGYITNAVNDLTNYYTKTQTYTKTEVDQMISEFGGFEVVETLPTENIKTNVIYLKGPIGTGGDKYEEWIYSNSQWVLIGETSVDLSNYFNTFTDTSDRITEGSTNLFVTSSEKSTWNAKQDALVSGTNIKTVNGNSLLGSGDVVIPLGKNDIVRSALPPQDTTVLWYDTANFVLNYYNDDAWKPLGVVNGGSVEPNYNITGNLWYDINNNVLRVYRVGTGWKDLAYGTSASTAPTTVSAGHIWYDTTNNILKVYNGTAWENVNTNTTYTAGNGISISNDEISVDTTVVATKTDLNSKQDTLTAGANITIAQDGTISATDTTYTAGTGIDITNGVITNTQTSAEWGNITGTLSDQTDLQDALDDKQDVLVSGTNIKTVNNTSLLGSGNIDIPSGKNDIVTSVTAPSDHSVLWIKDNSGAQNPNELYYYDNEEGEWVAFNGVYEGDTAPSYFNLWYDTYDDTLKVSDSRTSNQFSPICLISYGSSSAPGATLWYYRDDDTGDSRLKYYDEDTSEWQDIRGPYINSSAPYDTDFGEMGGLWVDTSGTYPVMKYYDAENTTWKPIGGVTYTAGDGIDITNNEISVDVSDLAGTGLSTDGSNNLIVDTDVIQGKLHAGDGINIDSGNEISVDVSDLAGTGLSTDANDNLIVDSTVVALKTDLANYYTKTETYTKTEVDNLIASFGNFEVVASLPSVSTASEKTIYLLGPIGTGADKYEEWIVTESEGVKSWTKIGETSMDLSNYVTSTQLTTTLQNYATTTQLATKQDILTAGDGINIDANNEISNTLPGPTIAASAPTGTEGALWYDTTNDILMAHDGTDWKKAGTQMKVLSYGYSTWQDFIDAYNENAIVYCRASSNSNPATGTQGRMAFMAFVNNAGNPTEVEFQYYRSRSDHNSAANQVDEVYVYKLVPTNGGTWTVTQRNTAAKLVAGSNVSITWGSGNAVINATDTKYTAGTNITIDANNVISATDTKYTAGDGIDITNNEISVDTDVVQEKLTAGTGISITGGTVCTTESDRKGPAPEGFHVPAITEWEGVKTIMDSLSLATGNSWRINLHMPFAGYRNSSASIAYQGSGLYWSSSPYGNKASYLYLYSSDIYTEVSDARASGRLVRCLKNSYVAPDSTWTVVQGILGSAGIFWSQSEGLISITSDGSTGYTMMDKNLGATTVYSDGDTLTQANMGNMYQWGNSYGFPSTGTISNTSSTQVDASGYGPSTANGYYESGTYITGSNDWSSVQNDDLWGDTSNSTHQECTTSPLTISSTVNGFNPSNAGTEGQVLTKTSTGYNWAATSKGVTVGTTAPSNPSAGDLWYDTTSTVLALKVYNGTAWQMVGPEVVPITQAAYDALSTDEKNNGKFYLITNASGTISVDWANVNNKVALTSADIKTGTSTTAGIVSPSVLAGAVPVLSTQTGQTLSSVKIWVGSQTDYEALTTKDPNTLYFTTNVVSGS